MLCLAWQYLTGRCVATDFGDRERAEWPPHPDRVFQALVAAWGERGEDPEERKVLEWLETLGAPCLIVPDILPETAPVKVYVPVNDIESRQKVYGDPMISLLPESRGRKERFFPSVQVGEGITALVWPEADIHSYHQVLSKLCGEVQRIGHSSSFVRCWLDVSLPASISYTPSVGSHRHDLVLRTSEPGRLKALCEHHQSIVEKRIEDVLPPRARQIGYLRAEVDSTVSQGDFTSPLLVLRQVGGTRFSLRQTLDACTTLRQALIQKAEGVSPLAKQIVSGHAPDGSTLRGLPHLAYLPLAFVGDHHADGHLLGLGLAFPKGLDPLAEDDVFRCLGHLMDPETGRIRLVLGAKGEMDLEIEDRMSPAKALASESWCNSSSTWATATPLVMDRMQNSRRSDPEGWVIDQIYKMCEYQKLPRPIQVVLRSVSRLEGVPMIREFPPLLKRDGSSCKMIHAQITWSKPVRGPILLGAGRYKGYGFCKPIRNGVSPC